MRNLCLLHTVAALALIACACSRRPENVAGEKKMVKVMADMEIAEAYLQSEGAYRENNDTKEGILEHILQKNGMTREEFDSTLSWYGRNIDKYEELYAKVDKELADRGKKVSGNIQDEVINDLWPYVRQLTISPLSSSDNLVFNIDGSDVTKGERVQWKLKMQNPTEGMALLGVKYTDGSISYTNQPVTRRNNLEMSLQTDTGRIVKGVFGNLRISDRKSLPLRIDSITLSTLPYDSLEYYRINSTRHYHGPVKKTVKENPDTISGSNFARSMAEESPYKAGSISGIEKSNADNKHVKGINGKKIRRATDTPAGISQPKATVKNLKR